MLLPGPLYLFEPRKDYPIPQKLTLTTVVECWNLCIMHLWRNMQIRAILVLCLSMLILHSHPANSQWVEFFFMKEKSILNACARTVMYQRTAGPLGPLEDRSVQDLKITKRTSKDLFFEPETIIKFFKMASLEF